ncbi:hypothetical protein BGV40_11930 [Methanosarcina sp. Ant1]|nr:hypothetical protein BGV40_11930 [Methanosarcina sp. Ant1]
MQLDKTKKKNLWGLPEMSSWSLILNNPQALVQSRIPGTVRELTDAHILGIQNNIHPAAMEVNS